MFRVIAPSMVQALEEKIAQGYEGPIANPAVTVTMNYMREVIQEAIHASADMFDSQEAANAYLAETSLRAAMYFISAAPMEEQDKMLQEVVENLPRYVQIARERGWVINCVWNFGAGDTFSQPGRSGHAH
jgi:hypothetical protein